MFISKIKTINTAKNPCKPKKKNNKYLENFLYLNRFKVLEQEETNEKEYQHDISRPADQP